jgi:glycosyltransferase involved in cell wall biosynthesis
MADNRLLISVALATYNGSRFLREQLDSIYAQTWLPVEVVVCDDRSSDDTVSILEEYRQRHGLRYEANEQNLGFVRNFEKAMAICRGEFIALADQDDVWLPEKLERLMAGIGTSSLIYSDAFLIDDGGRELPGSLIATSGVLPVNGANFRYFVCNSCVTGCTALFRRDLLNTALPIPECETYHDWWLALAASKRGGVRYLPERLVRYRQHAANQAGVSRKTGLVSRLGAHLGAEAKRLKGQYYRLLRDRGALFPAMRDRLALTDAEVDFLHDMERYGNGLLDSRPHLALVALAWRYREILFPTASPLERLVFIASSFIK